MSKMLRLLLAATIMVAILAAGCTGVHAQSWQWPQQMTVGGFSVTGISGRANADGSGLATGTLQIPGLGGHRVQLERSSRGDVSGSAALNLRVSAAEIQGNFALNNSGLKGQGTVKSSPKPITGASVSISSGGQATGNGRVVLARASVPVSFTVSGSTLSVSGTASVQDVQDTALANYRFSGSVRLQCTSGKIEGSANGQVTRRGKLADQPTDYTVSNVKVDVSTGRCPVNAGGVNVVFVF